MGVRRFEDLIAWQLAHELQNEVFAMTAVRPASDDIDFCDQINDSARSATRNIAEGFGRFYPKEFIRFLRIAAGSLQETQNHLIDALDRGYITADKFEQLKRLTLRAFKANTRLSAYLETSGSKALASRSRKLREKP